MKKLLITLFFGVIFCASSMADVRINYSYTPPTTREDGEALEIKEGIVYELFEIIDGERKLLITNPYNVTSGTISKPAGYTGGAFQIRVVDTAKNLTGGFTEIIYASLPDSLPIIYARPGKPTLRITIEQFDSATGSPD